MPKTDLKPLWERGFVDFKVAYDPERPGINQAASTQGRFHFQILEFTAPPASPPK